MDNHAEGNQSVTRGSGAHAEGNLTVASGTSAHAEGFTTVSTGFVARCESPYATTPKPPTCPHCGRSDDPPDSAVPAYR